jgi:C1q domain
MPCVPLATPACVCFPDQFAPPSENVALEVELSAANGTVGMSKTPKAIAFNQVRTSSGEVATYSFNTTGGFFTAPSAGPYAFDFDVSVATPAGASACTLTYAIYVNGAAQAKTADVAATTAAGQTVNDHIHVNLSLARGDVVQVVASSSIGEPIWVFASDVFPKPSPTNLSITSLFT